MTVFVIVWNIKVCYLCFDYSFVFLGNLQECVFCFKGGMGNQGMMFGNEPVTSTQVTIPKDVSNTYVCIYAVSTFPCMLW